MPGVDAYRATDALMRDRLDLYCRNLVKVKGKDGKVVPFAWNRAQAELDRIIRQQIEARGLVRVIVLKARQLGISTYVAARFYRKTTLWTGQQTYILTHEDKATRNLFGMAKRIHAHMPRDYKPKATTQNANELAFAGLGSGYLVGTAKNVAGTGRSQTLQNFHGSEVAFWADPEEHFAGAMQAVSLARGTEVIFESTANGIGGVFYNQWALAERRQSDFVPVFLPWYWADEYRREPDAKWQPSTEEVDYGLLHGLDEWQLCWAHFKNIELGGEAGKFGATFRQEYPATAQEAFQGSGEDSYIPAEMVLRARRFEAPDQSHNARVIGVDVAGGHGADKTRLIDRHGRRAGKLRMDIKGGAVDVANQVGRVLNLHPDILACFIDVTGGYGSGVYDILQAMGFSTRVRGVNFGSSATQDTRYQNKRAEMYGGLKEWLADPGGAQIPDDDALHQEICAPGYRHDANSRLLLEPKEKIKARLGFSPDEADALVLTFAEPVHKPPDRKPSWRDEIEQPAVDWMTR